MASEDSFLQTLVIILTVIVLLPLLVMVFMVPMGGMWGGGHMWNGGMWDGSGPVWTWFLMWVVFLAIIVGGGYLLFRSVSGSTSHDSDPALEELRIAYARGDISDEEFEQRRRKLQSQDEG